MGTAATDLPGVMAGGQADPLTYLDPPDRRAGSTAARAALAGNLRLAPDEYATLADGAGPEVATRLFVLLYTAAPSTA
jgi:hypothetical protein